MCLISIVIPIYNTGKYLTRTLSCVEAQTYKNIEVLLIDDGSTDNSSTICNQYVLKDSRFKYYRKENGGICSARNYGLDKCHGDYIYFSDHDDFLVDNLVEKVVEEIKKTNADIIKFGVELYDEEKNKSEYRTYHESCFYNRNELLGHIMDDINKGFYSNIWDCIYSRRFIEKNSLLFDTRYKKGYEDIVFNFALLDKINTIAFIPDILYVHYKWKGYSTSSKRNTDILNCLLDNPKRINSVITRIPELKSSQVELSYYYIHTYMISVISYSKKLGIPREDILNKLDEGFQSVFKYLNDISMIDLAIYAYRQGGLKNLFFPVIYILYKRKIYNSLYMLI